MIELADIAWKRVLQEPFPGHFVEASDLLPITLRVLTQKMVRQRHDIFAPLAQRRQWDLDCVQTKEQILTKATCGTSSLTFALVADMIRTFAWRVFEEPTRSNSPVSIIRNSLACWLSGMFAISSMKSVLSSASSNRPARSVFASVNAPFTCPNNSLSNSVCERPPMLTVIMDFPARGESE